MIKEHFAALHADENIFYFNEDSGNVVFSCNEIGILNIDLCNINLDNKDDEDGDDSDTIIHIRYLTWYVKFEKRKELKKRFNEDLMPVACYPKRWWNFCMSEGEKKGTDFY